MLTIGQVADLAGTTVRAVRHYHQTGLLPEPPRGANGYRRYRGSDLSRLIQIRQLGELGLALADIRRLVDGSVADRREALETLRNHYAEQERQLAERRARITELLTVEGDPAIPTRLRVSANNLRAIGVPEDLLAVDADILRTSSGLMSPDDQRLIDGAVATMADDPELVATIAANLRRLDEVASLSPDHPDITALAQDFAALLQTTWPDLAGPAVGDAAVNPDLDWLIQDLLAERLTPAQLAVVRGLIELLRTSGDTTVAGNDASGLSCMDRRRATRATGLPSLGTCGVDAASAAERAGEPRRGRGRGLIRGNESAGHDASPGS